MAIAWPLARKPWIVPIPGTTKLQWLDENLGAATIQLTDDGLGHIESAVSKVDVHGDRYSPEHQARAGR